MFSKSFFKSTFQRRSVFKTVAAALALCSVPVCLRAAFGAPTLQAQPALAEAHCMDDEAGGLIQIRVIGFGAHGFAALEYVAAFPAPGLSFVLPEILSGARGQTIDNAIDRLLDCKQTVVLLVDESDVEQTRQAVLVGKRAKAHGLVVIGVALAGRSDTAAKTFAHSAAHDLAGSMHSFVRLNALESGTALGGRAGPGSTAATLLSLTSGLASVCNLVPIAIAVDYEDVLTVLGRPARLSVGIGMAAGGDRVLVAVAAAMADLGPDWANSCRVHGLLVTVAAAPGQLRLSECKAAFNAVRSNFNEQVHLIYAATADTRLAGQTSELINGKGATGNGQLRVTIMATSLR